MLAAGSGRGERVEARQPGDQAREHGRAAGCRCGDEQQVVGAVEAHQRGTQGLGAAAAGGPVGLEAKQPHRVAFAVGGVSPAGLDDRQFDATAPAARAGLLPEPGQFRLEPVGIDAGVQAQGEPRRTAPPPISGVGADSSGNPPCCWAGRLSIVLDAMCSASHGAMAASVKKCAFVTTPKHFG